MFHVVSEIYPRAAKAGARNSPCDLDVVDHDEPRIQLVHELLLRADVTLRAIFRQRVRESPTECIQHPYEWVKPRAARLDAPLGYLDVEIV
jgi:hypothetical protein